jgi:hypothetical protein
MAVMLDAEERTIDVQATPVLEPPPDYWEKATLLVSIVPNVRYLSVIVMGQDGKFWSGNYGSKVTEISVRLLGVPEEIQKYLVAPTSNPSTHGAFATQPIQVRFRVDGVENLLHDRRPSQTLPCDCSIKKFSNHHHSFHRQVDFYT